jgi:photoactive yellow protein
MTILCQEQEAVSFGQAALLASLEDMDNAMLDGLPFGVIRMDNAGCVLAYNACESREAGIRRDDVLGRHFFSTVGPCLNNFLVAQRFENEPEIDAIIDFIVTLHMRPVPVRLRLLKSVACPHWYLLVERRQQRPSQS